MARVIALTAHTALGLSGGSSHEPFRANGGQRPMAITERSDQNPPQRNLLICSTGQSNRFTDAGASASLAVVDVSDALKGRPALLGYLPAGRFPRQMAVEQGGRTLLVTNFDSSQLESVNVADLPSAYRIAAAGMTRRIWQPSPRAISQGHRRSITATGVCGYDGSIGLRIKRPEADGTGRALSDR